MVPPGTPVGETVKVLPVQIDAVWLLIAAEGLIVITVLKLPPVHRPFVGVTV